MPAAGTGQLLRLGSVGMAPGQNVAVFFFGVIMIVRMAVSMIMGVIVRVLRMIVIAVIGFMIMRLMIMRVVSVMIVPVRCRLRSPHQMIQSPATCEGSPCP